MRKSPRFSHPILLPSHSLDFSGLLSSCFLPSDHSGSLRNHGACRAFRGTEAIGGKGVFLPVQRFELRSHQTQRCDCDSFFFFGEIYCGPAVMFVDDTMNYREWTVVSVFCCVSYARTPFSTPAPAF